VTQVFLYCLQTPSPVMYFPDPGNWTINNKIEIVGPGSRGGAGYQNMYSGHGGAGGSYAKIEALEITSWPVPYVVQAGNYDLDTTKAYYSCFNTAVWNVVGAQPNAVGVRSPFPATGYYQGMGSTDFYPAGHKGGDGGRGTSGLPPLERSPGMYDVGAGGGGAAGPLGVGANGGNGNDTESGYGGASDGGSGWGVPPGYNGVNNHRWDYQHGCGSGGGGATMNARTGAGGAYGGGSGGGSAAYAGQAYGSSGLIIITYTQDAGSTNAMIIS
jgi:hypothetical protein